tara:strand:- start:5410 stop:5670 length:261 start_codon:yes stop_codon:yes gene_type:complete
MSATDSPAPDSKPRNPYAFPSSDIKVKADGTHYKNIFVGMTLRDHFAGQAMAAMLAVPMLDWTMQEIVLDAYAYADAMLAERSKSE